MIRYHPYASRGEYSIIELTDGAKQIRPNRIGAAPPICTADLTYRLSNYLFHSARIFARGSPWQTNGPAPKLGRLDKMIGPINFGGARIPFAHLRDRLIPPYLDLPLIGYLNSVYG